MSSREAPSWEAEPGQFSWAWLRNIDLLSIVTETVGSGWEREGARRGLVGSGEVPEVLPMNVVLGGRSSHDWGDGPLGPGAAVDGAWGGAGRARGRKASLVPGSRVEFPSVLAFEVWA